MKYVNMNNQTMKASAIIVGCMRIAGMEERELDQLIHTSLELGINTFDHADIYGGGVSEEKFGKILAEQPHLREKLFLQSKCGIREGYFDFSKEHILESRLKSIEDKRLSQALIFINKSEWKRHFTSEKKHI